MASFDQNDARVLASNGSDKYADFTNLCVGVYLVADGDCFVNFDKPAIASSSFLIKANLPYFLEKVQFTQLHSITSGGSVNLYILAIK